MSANYVIHPIPLMITHFPKPLLTYLCNFGKLERVGHFVWYIEGPRENIIVDAGFTMERCLARGFKAEHIQTLDEGLKKLGLEFGDIDIVLITHMDHDHISLAHKFSKAKLIVQHAELEDARNPHPIFKVFRPGDYMELIEGLHFEEVNGDTRIDEGIELLFTPGHTPGGQSVAVKTAKGTAIITGWCCIRENFNPPTVARERGLFFIPPGNHTDLMQAYESTARVVNLADIIIPVHELGFVNIPTIP